MSFSVQTPRSLSSPREVVKLTQEQIDELEEQASDLLLQVHRSPLLWAQYH